jgi:hypothetical protein
MLGEYRIPSHSVISNWEWNHHKTFPFFHCSIKKYIKNRKNIRNIIYQFVFSGNEKRSFTIFYIKFLCNWTRKKNWNWNKIKIFQPNSLFFLGRISWFWWHNFLPFFFQRPISQLHHLATTPKMRSRVKLNTKSSRIKNY